jgi:hypothetical protein
VTRDCHAGILREPGGEIPPGHPTRSVLCQRSSVSDKFEFIDVEYAAYQESGEQYVPSIVKMCIWMEEGYLKLNSKKYRLITALNESEKVRSGRR